MTKGCALTLTDESLLADIQLLGDVILAVNLLPRPLRESEVDEALGVSHPVMRSATYLAVGPSGPDATCAVGNAHTATMAGGRNSTPEPRPPTCPKASSSVGQEDCADAPKRDGVRYLIPTTWKVRGARQQTAPVPRVLHPRAFRSKRGR
jgi:hypothetical protein